ncbi:unnamed protein product [Parnassius apollo]|uniref:(apollo) hypothetical protein n=1 Tax=Parnassius apollo TaxID=110799 RepID=A0A8S3XWL7_PARAO|nr:unnamed protein product [Parnassius apollo]
MDIVLLDKLDSSSEEDYAEFDLHVLYWISNHMKFTEEYAEYRLLITWMKKTNEYSTQYAQVHSNNDRQRQQTRYIERAI